MPLVSVPRLFSRLSSTMRAVSIHTPPTKRLTAALLIGVLCGCDQMSKESPPKLTGTFSGTSEDGRPLSVTLKQTKNTVVGAGDWAGESFGLSALTSPQGPFVLTFEGGSGGRGHLALSLNGEALTVRGFGAPVTLSRGGTPMAPASGGFAGTYSASGPRPVRLRLSQGEDLLAGTGYVNGRPVAVAGKIIEPDKARGTVLFSDESRNAVSATLSDDGGTLTVRGLGGLIEMQRQ